jgi:hypothetical protein
VGGVIALNTMESHWTPASAGVTIFLGPMIVQK